ncbi:MAG: hypothetical protein AAGG75_21235 [Bacteroidota bacterium]
MPIQKYYPPLSDLIDARAIPGDFEALENTLNEGIDLLLGKVYYKNLSVQLLKSGETRYYSITLLTKSIRLPLFSDMNLVFFRGADAALAEFAILFEWSWPISKYIARFDAQGFSYAPEAFLDILIELSEIRDRNDFFNQMISVFLNNGDDAYLDFFSDITTIINDYDNSVPAVTTEIQSIISNLTAIKDEVQTQLTVTNQFSIASLFENYQNNTIIGPAVEAISTSIETLRRDHNISIDVIGDVLRALIGGFSNIDEKFDRLLSLFRTWLEDIDIDDLKRLLIPQFGIELEGINMGLEFPRKWLVPAIPDTGNPGSYIEDPDTNNLATLEFTVGDLKVSTKNGLEFDNQSSFTFERAYIGKTGIMLEFINLKVDMSKSYNIPEAEADGRPADFQGVYCERATVTLPPKWFKNQTPGSTAEVFGNDLLIGTGGVSGTLGLEAVGGNDILWANIGDNDGFRVGFKHFDIKFKQNKILSSKIEGAMEIAKFVYPAGTVNEQGQSIAGDPVTIGITGHIHDDGDFNLTASAEPPYPIEFPDVFIYSIKSLELGREDDDFYVGTSGRLEFQGFLKDTLKLKAIDVDRLRIYSDGTIEFEGGSIALVEPIVLPLGPVEITVSAIHYGSHQREVDGVMRKYNYFGFDGGVSVDPLGVEIRGDGVKYYYCTDNLPNKPPAYLHIQTLYLDLTIPASSPAAIINGWLSIPEPGTSPEYAGGISIQLPKAKIAGSADMKLQPRYPAFIIDASIELPAPIPLGPVGIYGFRGLIGYRYVAEKEAVGLVSGVDTWYDYYKKAPRGISVTKFNGPDRTTASGTPFSIGAGASLGTSADNGTILNIKAMVLLSIPSLFMIDGRASILSARLGLDDPGDPPFFAFIALGDNSLELGFGADFKMPSSSGDILRLYADVQAGFFFNDSSRWYVNIGTKTNPITARVLTLLTITSYVMLSSKGIEAGARGEFNFRRKYGPIKVAAWAYVEIGGKISFEKPQFGAYLAAGVGADIDIKIVSLYASFDVLFGVEAPKPFLIYGEFRLCVRIRIAWIFKFRFCGNLKISWEFNSTVDRSPIDPMINPANAGTVGEVVQGVNMLSNETFELAYLGSAAPTNLPNAIKDKIIPLDTYIDIKTEKGLLPAAIDSIIGGINNPPIRYTENVPPEKIIRGKEVRQVTHQFSIESITLKSWNPQTSSWNDYHPYKALYPSDPNLNNLKIGQFQKTDGQYSTIRLLATTPFSYTEQGQPGWYIPEQYGITPASLFCEGERKVKKCANFLEKPLGFKYYCYDQNHLFYANGVAFYLYNKADEEYGLITDESNPFGFAQSLRFENLNILQIRLPQPSVEISLKLTTYSQGVTIRYFASLIDDTTSQIQYGHPNPSASNQSAPYEVNLNASGLAVPVNYSQPNWRPITRIEIVPKFPNSAQIEALQEQIAAIIHNNILIQLGLTSGQIQSTESLERELEQLLEIGCTLVQPGGGSTEPLPVKESAAPAPPKCSAEAICTFYFEVKNIAPCFIVDRVSDWSPQVVCAENLLGLLYNFDRNNPDCLVIENNSNLPGILTNFMNNPGYSTLDPVLTGVDALLAFLNQQGNCEPTCIKDEEICAIWKRIFDIRNDCLSHPLQYSPNSLTEYLSCFREILDILTQVNVEVLRQQISPKTEAIYSFLARPTPETYRTAWDNLQCILDLLLEYGNCNCQNDDRKCYTLLHEVCWLSLEAYQFNINIPGQAAIEADAQAAIDGITQYIQPIWRPDTHYFVRFVLKDVVDNDTAGATSYAYTYGFTTAGPVGYFHTDEKATYGDYIDSNGNTVEDANGIVRDPSGNIIPQSPPLTPHPEKYALTNLKRYIDYQRSYPNADGNLLSAKPLFYDDETTKIDLFFIKAYATHFFHTWQAYNGQDPVSGRIKIVIKDPREGDSIVNPPYLDYDPADTIHTNIPQTIESWEDDPNPIMPHVLAQYASLFEANDCIATGGNTIIPRSSSLQVIPKHLKPLKLYTALVNNLYDLDGDSAYNTTTETREVHRFTFQTSRYATFKEQIESYLLTDNDPVNPATRAAVFDIKKGFTLAQVQAAYATILGASNPLSDSLAIDYQHPYDRIFEGILGFTPLDDAISTEFNLVKDSSDGDKIIALIIRNPEPFNNPRIPLAEIEDTIQVLNNAGVADSNYKILFSKDYSQAIIMRPSLSITPGQFDFKFLYKLWNGSNYVVPGTPQYSTNEVGTIVINNLELL